MEEFLLTDKNENVLPEGAKFRTIINKKDLVKAVARESRVKIPQVKLVFDAVETIIAREISQRVDANNELDINLFTGLKLICRYKKPKYKKTGISKTGGIYVPERISIKANVSRRFKEGINDISLVGG